MPQRQHELCTVEGCGRKHKTRGYCGTHYQQFRRGAPITPVINARDMNPPEHCTEAGCIQPAAGKGLCQMHRMRVLRHGHTKYTDRKRPPKPCTYPGCQNHLYAKSLCHQHYIRGERLKKKFGITLLDVDAMLLAQGMVCAICGSTSKKVDYRSKKLHDFSVDHCHVTGKVRGLLCSDCNRGIGLLGDDPAVLRRAADYIDRHRLQAA